MEQLIAWREGQGLTVAEAAELVGVTRAAWWRWEQGKRAISGELVLKIERITGISRHDLRPDLSRIFIGSPPAPETEAA